jgi:prepilin-type N-terminal cleavage/methylation domain-containing protein
VNKRHIIDRQLSRFNNPSTSLKQAGFSILELAIVLVIVGLLTAASVAMYSEQRIHVKWQEGGAHLKLAKSALLQFAKQNKFLPCPDTDNDGYENRGAIACSAVSGDVPFNELGLTVSDIQDSWGNELIYAINQDAVSPTSIADCPINSACFFNNTAPPMFDLTTLPAVGNSGVNNLRVCLTSPCNAATVNTSLLGDDLIVVLLATNQNGDETTGLSVSEQANRDGDLFFVADTYSKATPFYDDLIETISANELKGRYEPEIIALVNATTPNAIAGGSIATLGQNKDTGGSGDNVQSNPIEAWDYNSQTFDFGTENANKQVTISLKTEVIGGWEDGSVSGQTRDSFIVGINGDTPADSGALTTEDYNDIGQTVLGDYSYYDPTNNNNTGYRDNDAWYEYLEYNVQLDDSGQVDLNFIVGSTHEEEVVNISDVEVVLYGPPPSMPEMPEMPSVNTSGIDLGDDSNKLDVFQ